MRRVAVPVVVLVTVLAVLVGLSTPSGAKVAKATASTTTTAAPTTTTAAAPSTTTTTSAVAVTTTTAAPVTTTTAAPVTTTTTAAPEPVATSVATTTLPAPSTTTATADACTAPALRVVPVSTAATLQTALNGARPGDRIALADGVYAGRFVVKVSGLPTSRILVCGGRDAILDGGSTTTGYGLSVKASYVDLRGFTVRNSQKGIVLDGSSFDVLDGLEVHTIGDEAVHFRTASTNNRIANSVIHDTGKRVADYGEGVYVGSASNNWCTYTACLPDASDLNVVENNRFFSIAADAVDIKEGTTGGSVLGNEFDGTGSVALSWVDVKGNSWTISGNRGRVATRDGFLTSIAVTGWGTGNVFSANHAEVDGPGYGYNVRPGNVVLCNNTVAAAAKGLSNVLCTNQ